MPQQRETVTDRLANVIEVIQLGRKTGQLSVERGAGSTYEEGYISFLNGQVIQAVTGWRSGQEALNWLIDWGACRFTFIPDASARTTGKLSALSTPSTSPLSPTPSASQKVLQAAAQPTRPSIQRVVSTGKTGSPGGPFPTQLSPEVPASGAEATSNGVAAPAHPDTGPLAPYRTRQLDEALWLLERRGLSRAHRHLLLLIDGQRTVAELVRLTGRRQDEVQQLLRDLETATLIQQR